MEVPLNIAVMPLRGRLALGAALLALAGGLALPHAAHAAATDNTVCKGSITKGAKNVDFDTPIDYKLACSNYITSYSIIFPGRTIDSVSTEVFGLDPTTNDVVPADAFSCNGDIPGYGINCVGTYTGAFHTIPGSVDSQGDPCATEAGPAYAIVTYATYAQAADGTPTLSGSGKPTVTTNTAGPFSLGRLKGCSTASAKAKAKAKAKVNR
jgi:hypothetical protein